MSVVHGEYVLRKNQMAYLQGYTELTQQRLTTIVRFLPAHERIALKVAIRLCMRDPNGKTLLDLFLSEKRV